MHARGTREGRVGGKRHTIPGSSAHSVRRRTKISKRVDQIITKVAGPHHAGDGAGAAAGVVTDADAGAAAAAAAAAAAGAWAAASAGCDGRTHVAEPSECRQ